jgi:glycosyltransferase involved in cell wall biosynthesis/tetratricopeptide (TPR) repeat protein
MAVQNEPQSQTTPDRPTPSKLIQQGDRLLKQGQLSEAIDAYEQAVQLQPKSAAFQYKLGYAWFQSGELEKAEEFYRQALELESSLHWGHYGLALVAQAKGQMAAAVTACKSVLELVPDFEPGRSLLTSLQKAQQQKIQPEAQSKAQLKEPSKVQKQMVATEYWQQAEQYIQQKKWEAAIAAYQKGLELEPQNAKAHHQLGDLWLKLDRPEKAIICYQQALDINPKSAWSYHNFSVVLGNLDRWEAAIAAHEKVAELKPDFWELSGANADFLVQYHLGRVLVKQERWEAAIAPLRKSVALNSQHHLAWHYLGEALSKQGLLDESIESYQQAIQLKPSFFWAQIKLADVLQAQERFEESILHYQSALKTNPGNFWAYANLGQAYARCGSFEQAAEIYQQAIQINPKMDIAYLRLAEVFEKQGKFDAAVKTYEKAATVKPDVPLIEQRLKVALEKKEYFRKLEIEYKRSESLRKKDDLDLYILDTHSQEASGLGLLSRRCHRLGKLVADTRDVSGKVLVAGRPDLYKTLVKSENINYIWTTFESDRIPESWVLAINENFDEVFVPHQYVLESFRNSGVQRPISIIPQAFPLRHRTQPINKDPGKLRLGMLGVPNLRKNFEKVVEAVQHLRNSGRNVELYIHCPHLIHESQSDWAKIPGVYLTQGVFSDAEIDAWYSQLDAYIYPSSGEGWSFTPREAMSLGIPTIVSDIPLHQDLVESRKFVTVCSSEYEPAYYEFLGTHCGLWKKYSVDAIVGGIIHLMDDYQNWYERAQNAREWILQECQWQDTEQKLIGEIFPKELVLCPTKYQNCGIHTYTQKLVTHLPQTKYVSSYEQVKMLLDREPIESIHVQFEGGIYNLQELYDQALQWNCHRKITIHGFISQNHDAAFWGLLTLFQNVFSLSKEMISQIGDRAKVTFLPHGAMIPPKLALSPRVSPFTIATFGFIHESKGYPYLLEATQKLGIRLRVIGLLRQDLPSRQQTWETYIQGQENVEHFDGFLPEVQVLHLLSEAEILVFYYRDSDYLYQSGAVLEAARSQRPIICSSTTPLRGLQGCVHYVPYGDIDALVSAIQLLRESPEYRDTLVRAMNRHLVWCEWSIVAQQLSTAPKTGKLSVYPSFKQTPRSVKRVAVIGNYLPRKCGIATFTSDLCNGLKSQYPEVEIVAIPMNDLKAGYAYPDIVKLEIDQHSLGSYYRAADYLNSHQFDVVCLQHEYGIFGGSAGRYILSLLERLNMPVVATLHTVLKEPDPDQRFVLNELGKLCYKLVVMSEKAEIFLESVFRIPKQKVEQIFHGVHDVEFTDPNQHKEQFNLTNQNVILSFGLLGRSKGTEYVIQALPKIIKKFPHTQYLYVGATHPHLVKHEGELYRESLHQLACDLGVENHVKFINKFAELDELMSYIGAADIYVTPYLNPSQITSGTLAYTVSAGKAVISTPYWHAEELLKDGRGILVPFKDSDAIAQQVIRLLRNPKTLSEIRQRAYLYGRQMTWSVVAQQYMKLLTLSLND